MSAEEGRVFLRGISSEMYGLSEQRARQRAAPRVVRAGTVVDGSSFGYSTDFGRSSATWMIGPGDDPFLTQSLQVHFVELFPGGANHGHGHQNEACFYILEGRGYEIHDGVRYDWEHDDFVIVHSESVHQHFNASKEERALALVFKAKAVWLSLGLIQQGQSGPFDKPGFGPRQDWSQLWTPGATAKSKVVRNADTRWEDTRDGHVRIVSSPDTTNVRARSVDLYQQEIPAGGGSAKHWHMADEVLYIQSGRGESAQWDVEAEIDDRYYARVALEPMRWSFTAGDFVYVPQNTIHQTLNQGSEPLVMIAAQNRAFKHLGYDRTVYLEDASVGRVKEAATAKA